MPEQLGSDDNIVCGSVDESLMLLVPRIGLVVDDEIKDRSAPIWIGDEYFLA